VSGLPRSPATVENRISVSVRVAGVRARGGLEDGGLGVRADVVRHLEVAERAAALGVGLALGDALAVEVGHLLDEVVVLQQDGAVGADGQRVFVAVDGDACVGGGRLAVACHGGSSFACLAWTRGRRWRLRAGPRARG
jgi:hypothetical protein